jgi:hypothetical protein
MPARPGDDATRRARSEGGGGERFAGPRRPPAPRAPAAGPSIPLAAEAVLALQRAAGNAAVSRLLVPGGRRAVARTRGKWGEVYGAFKRRPSTDDIAQNSILDAIKAYEAALGAGVVAREKDALGAIILACDRALRWGGRRGAEETAAIHDLAASARDQIRLMVGVDDPGALLAFIAANRTNRTALDGRLATEWAAARDPIQLHAFLGSHFATDVVVVAAVDAAHQALRGARGTGYVPQTIPQGAPYKNPQRTANTAADARYKAMMTNRLEAPYKNAIGKDFREGTFGWTFNYLIKEIETDKGIAHLKKVMTPDGEPYPLVTAEMTAVLAAMVVDAFIDFPADRQVALQNVMTKSPLHGKSTTHTVGFRGDQRPILTIRQHHGMKAKADVGPLQKQLGFDQPWSPWNDPAVRQRALYRVKSDDNDLYTVVSVAQEWVDATKFPLVEEPATRTWKDRVDGPTLSSCTVYVMALTAGFDTMGLQKARTTPKTSTNLQQGESSSYGGGEFAVKSIGFPDLLYSFEVERAHLGPQGNDGHRARVGKVVPVLNEDAIRAKLGEEGFRALTDFLADLPGKVEEYNPAGTAIPANMPF